MKQISGTSKATTVFSPAKYPAPAHISEYQPLYIETNDGSGPKHSSYKLGEEPHVRHLGYFQSQTKD